MIKKYRQIENQNNRECIMMNFLNDESEQFQGLENTLLDLRGVKQSILSTCQKELWPQVYAPCERFRQQKNDYRDSLFYPSALKKKILAI